MSLGTILNVVVILTLLRQATFGQIDVTNVRLVGGNVPWEGRLELYIDRTWTTVCEDGFDLHDAHVLCKELDYRNGAIAVWGNAYFGAGSGPVLSDEIECIGSETDINDCPLKERIGYNCNHTQDVSIKCNLAGSFMSVRLVGGNVPWEGRVEITFRYQYWMSLCDDGFDMNDAHALCRDMDFRNGAIAVWGNAYFGAGSGPVLSDEIECIGSETDINDCPLKERIGYNCNHTQDVSIKCNLAGSFMSVRLVGGNVPWEGRVEITFRYQYWMSLCDDGFDMNDAHALCRDMDFRNGAIAVWGNAYFGAGSGPVLSDEIECIGSETDINDCPLKERIGYNCNHTQDVSIKCNLAGSFMSVRLVGGNVPWEGRVEITFRYQYWMSLCDDGFDMNDAHALCRDMDFRNGAIAVWGNAYFGAGSGPVLSDEIECIGSETDINDCPLKERIGYNCNHTQDVSIKCNLAGSFMSVRLVGGNVPWEGRVEITFRYQYWMSLCDDGFDMNDAHALCRDMDFRNGAIAVWGNAYFGAGSGPVLSDEIECIGSETDINDCPLKERIGYNCNHTQDVSIKCNLAGSFMSVRLVGGNVPWEGRVEITFRYQYWMSLCDDGFDMNDAHALCRDMDFRNGAIAVWGNEYFGAGSGPVLSDEIECIGSETDINDCPLKERIGYNCNHTQDVSIKCNLAGSFMSVRLVGGNVPWEGRVEITFRYQYWMSLCDDGFDMNDAHALCRDMDFRNGAIAVWGNAYFGAGSGPVLSDEIECIGSETDINDCPLKERIGYNCNHTQDVSIKCNLAGSFMSVRLVGGNVPWEGRVEITFRYQYWMSLCDDGFDMNDAHALCRDMDFRNGAIAVWGNAYFGAGSGPVLSDEIECIGSETDINDCPLKERIGYNCNHTQDVSIKCNNSEDCSTQPCLNGATCINGVNSFTCSCTDGWTGTLCHIGDSTTTSTISTCETSSDRIEDPNCVSKAVQDVQIKVSALDENSSSNEIIEALDDIATLTAADYMNLSKSELETLADTLGDLANVINDDTLTETVTEGFIDVVNDLIDEKNSVAWENSETGAVPVLSAVDMFSTTLSDHLISSDEIQTLITKENVVIEVRKATHTDYVFPNDNETLGYAETWVHETSSSVLLKAENLEEHSSYTIRTTIYRNVSKIIPSDQSIESATIQEQKEISGPVIALSVYPPIDGNLYIPVSITFEHLEGNSRHATCNFWRFIENRSGYWSTEGCTVVSSNSTITVCECDHLTNFAVLMSPWQAADVGSVPLRIVSIVGIAVSILGLAFTMVLHISLWRYLKKDRALMLINLCIALMLSYIVFISGVDRTTNRKSCAAVAAMLQYIYLVVFFVMLAEGIEIGYRVKKVFSKKSHVKLLLTLAWFFPAVIVGISLGVTKTKGYGNKEFCWLSLESGLIWTFVGPALVVIIFNALCLAFVFRIMLGTKAMEQKETTDKIKASVRCLCVMLPLMGLTWIIGIFYVNEGSYWIQYVFAVCNGLQGFFIFLIHCVFNDQVRRAMANYRRRKSSSSMNSQQTTKKNPFSNKLELASADSFNQSKYEVDNSLPDNDNADDDSVNTTSTNPDFNGSLKRAPPFSKIYKTDA